MLICHLALRYMPNHYFQTANAAPIVALKLPCVHVSLSLLSVLSDCMTCVSLVNHSHSKTIKLKTCTLLNDWLADIYVAYLYKQMCSAFSVKTCYGLTKIIFTISVTSQWCNKSSLEISSIGISVLDYHGIEYHQHWRYHLKPRIKQATAIPTLWHSSARHRVNQNVTTHDNITVSTPSSAVQRQHTWYSQVTADSDE